MPPSSRNGTGNGTTPNGTHSPNGSGPAGRFGTPRLHDRDPDGLDPMVTSSAADWNAAAPRPHDAPGDELPYTDQHTKPTNPLYRIGRWVKRLFGDPHAGDATIDPDADAPGRGVHAITRTTDYWFEREIHAIENHARAQAAEWATKGLPRHDLPRTEALEPEQVLAAHCAQLFRDWQRRVRTRMQDAIEEGSQAVGTQVAALRNALTRLEAIRSENGELSQRLIRLRDEADREAGKPVRYERYINGATFWFGAAVLFLVEFFANFPVFRLLLPMSRALNTAAQAAAENINDTSWLAGPEMLAREMLMHIEAAVVALVAVFVLVLLGKTFGGALRPLVAFRAADFPLAAQTIRSHQRQKALLAVFCVLGLASALSFLYVSRGGIASMADERVQVEAKHLDTLRARAALLDRNDRTRIGQSAAEILVVENNKRFLEDDAAYARTVQKNNTPILGLNVALLLCAIVLGYSHQAEDLGDKRGEHPEIVAARERQGALDREMFEVLAQGRSAESQAHAEIARVYHLLNAHPLKEWRSKLQRVEGVIPLFRGENARLRGLDPANIRAFDAPAGLGLPPVNDDEGFREPTEFGRLRQEFQALGGEFARISPRMTPALGNAVIS